MVRLSPADRARICVIALAALTLAGIAACDAPAQPLAPDTAPQLDYASGGEPEPIECLDPTPLQKWTAAVGPAGGTFTMGPNTVVVPANAFSSNGLLYFRELSSTTLQVRVNSNITFTTPLEVIVSAENCEIDVAQTVWLYDESEQEFEELVDGGYQPGTDDMRFWTIQPGAYALAN